jgi:transposase
VARDGACQRDAAIMERDQACRRVSACGISCTSSSGLDPDQLNLAFEDIEQAIAATEADDDKKDPAGARERAGKRRTNRGALPSHLPRVHVTIEPDGTHCPRCRAPMHVIGDETASAST